MKVIIQRVLKSKITIDGKEEREIGKGFLVLVGITDSDTNADADFLAEKCTGLRVFEDEEGKMNVSLKDVGGELMIVSNFTLYGDCRKGKRPSFTSAARPETATLIYEYFIQKCKSFGVGVKTGEFGADMMIEPVLDGPITLVIESRNGKGI